MEVLAELVGGVVHQQLGALEAFGVVGEAEVDELSVVLYLLESGAGLIDVAIEHLLACDLGHGVDELRVEETLIAWVGLFGAEFELAEGLSVGKFFVDGRGQDWRAESENQR